MAVTQNHSGQSIILAGWVNELLKGSRSEGVIILQMHANIFGSHRHSLFKELKEITIQQ